MIDVYLNSSILHSSLVEILSPMKKSKLKGQWITWEDILKTIAKKAVLYAIRIFKNSIFRTVKIF